MNEFDTVAQAAAAVQERCGGGARVGLVLGSGLGDFAERIEGATAIPYNAIPGFPMPSVSGHKGRLVIGTLQGTRVAVLQGRVHGYEGYSASEVVRPVRVLIALGVQTIVVTNSAGSIAPQLLPGDLMLIRDQLNLTGQSPLVGPLDPRWPSRFVDLSGCYDPDLTACMQQVGSSQGLQLKQGVYAGLLGGAYETPAEVRMLGLMGADAVGMSTVLEVMAARHLGARAVGISCITNLASGLSAGPLSHHEVEQTAAQVRDAFASLLAASIPLLDRPT